MDHKIQIILTLARTIPQNRVTARTIANVRIVASGCRFQSAISNADDDDAMMNETIEIEIHINTAVNLIKYGSGKKILKTSGRPGGSRCVYIIRPNYTADQQPVATMIIYAIIHAISVRMM